MDLPKSITMLWLAINLLKQGNRLEKDEEELLERLYTQLVKRELYPNLTKSKT